MLFGNLFSRPKIAEISALEAHARHQDGAVILDVREVSEWRAGHIPGAVHIPLGRLAEQVGELDPASELIVVCRSGNRSAAATSALQQAGFANVRNLSGGMIAWTRQRLPVTR